MKKIKGFNRRDFIQSSIRASLVVSVGGIGGLALKNSTGKDWVWQIDPFECNQCGRCATECVRNPSAVKCVHAYDICGYCDLCGGYFIPGAVKLDTGAENQLCPTAALIRKFIEAKEGGDDKVVVWGTGVASREFLYSVDTAQAIIDFNVRLI